MKKINVLKLSETIATFPWKFQIHILARPAVSNGLIFVKWKQDLKYRSHAYFEPVRLHIIYQALAIRNFITNLMEIFLLQRASQVKKCSDFLVLLKFKEKMRVLLKKIISDEIKMSESIDEIETELNYFSSRSPKHAQNYIKWGNDYFWDSKHN